MKTLALLFLASSLPCFARLGETIDQSNARYGEPVADSVVEEAPGCIRMDFQKGGFSIEAHFLKGICVEIIFTKTETQQFGPTSIAIVDSMTEEEAKSLLEQNSEGSKWGNGVLRELKDPDSGAHLDNMIIWQRADGGYACLIDYSHLTIKGAHEEDYENAVTNAKQQKDAAEAQKTTKGL